MHRSQASEFDSDLTFVWEMSDYAGPLTNLNDVDRPVTVRYTQRKSKEDARTNEGGCGLCIQMRLYQSSVSRRSKPVIQIDFSYYRAHIPSLVTFNAHRSPMPTYTSGLCATRSLEPKVGSWQEAGKEKKRGRGRGNGEKWYL